MPQLDNLHTRLQSLDPLIIEPRVPRSLEPLFQIRLARLLEAEDARARLIEHLDERDVEVCRVGAEREVHGGECVLVAAVEDEGAAGRGPKRAVRNVGGFVDVGACMDVLRIGGERRLGWVCTWVDPLAGRLDKGAAAPCGLVEAEMRADAGGEDADREECVGEHGGVQLSGLWKRKWK